MSATTIAGPLRSGAWSGGGVGAYQTGQGGDQGRLAGPVRPQQAEKLARRDVERHAAQRLQRAKALDDVNDGDSGRHGHHSSERQQFADAVQLGQRADAIRNLGKFYG